jgi:hypothetical protein
VAIGSIAEFIEPEISTITPTVRVGSIVCLLWVLLQGSVLALTPLDFRA